MSGDPSSARYILLDQLAEEFAARWRRGERPSVQEYLERHPELADDLRQLLPALAEAEQVKQPEAAPPPGDAPRRLGDYVIVREIGRGGMGVVYEAEQVSLGRRVALKVLRRGDEHLRARFDREARAAARLHHSNIVPVFEVGRQDDDLFYAMQFIVGQPLDQVLRELQALRKGKTAAGAPARSLWTGRFEAPADPNLTVAHRTEAPASAPEPPAGAAPASELSTITSDFGRYCRNVAHLGAQAAEALAYAHARGVVHRDIKPSNLLLDTTGVLWVSDFGLAKTEDRALTETGDIVGTVRYMAPERFRGEGDARADVYALGLTLYELLTLTPAFDDTDRLRLIEKIGRQEPARPRSLEPRLPCDLETVVLKAMDRDADRRYRGADELADDLRRFLADQPVRARRIGTTERLWRWTRRNPQVASLTAMVLLVTLAGLLAVLWQWRTAVANAHRAEAAAEEVRRQADELGRINTDLLTANQRADVAALGRARTLYAARMNLIRSAWDEDNVAEVHALLEATKPRPGEPDLRGFEWYYWRKRSRPDRHVAWLPGDFGHTLSSDGSRFAYLAKGQGDSSAGSIRVWDTVSGSAPPASPTVSAPQAQGALSGVLNLSGDGRRVSGVFTWGPNGRQVSASLKTWDVASGNELLSADLETPVGVVRFSPDGSFVAVTAPGGVSVLDTRTGRMPIPLKAEESNQANDPAFVLLTPAWSGDGRRLAFLTNAAARPTSRWFGPRSGGRRYDIAVLDLPSGKIIHRLPLRAGGGDEVPSVALSPDGRHLAVVETTGFYSRNWRSTVRLADLATGEERVLWKGGALYWPVFTPDGTGLLLADFRTIRLLDPATGRERWRFSPPDPLPLARRSSRIDHLQVAFHPGQPLVAVSLQGSPVRVLDLETGEVRAERKDHYGNVEALALDRAGRLVTISLIDVHASTVLPANDVPLAVEAEEQERRTARVMLADPDGAFCAGLIDHAPAEAPRLQVPRAVGQWDTADGRLRRRLALPPTWRTPRGFLETVLLYLAHGGVSVPMQACSTAAMSPDGRYVLAFLTDVDAPGRVVHRLGDLEAGFWSAPLALGTETGALVFCCGFRSDGQEISFVRVKQVDPPRRDGPTTPWSDFRLEWVVFDVAGRLLRVVPLAGVMSLNRVGRAEPLSWLVSLCAVGQVSADGRRVAAVVPSRDWGMSLYPVELRVWDTETGQLLLSGSAGNLDGISGCVLSPDGRQVVTFQGGSRIEPAPVFTVWDVDGGRVVRRLSGMPGSATHAAFSPDNKRLALLTSDVRVFDLDSGQEVLRLPLSRGAGWLSFSRDGTRLVALGPGELGRSGVTVWEAPREP
jgi:serine/threonine protein kinase/WD40 repeat protein